MNIEDLDKFKCNQCNITIIDLNLSTDNQPKNQSYDRDDELITMQKTETRKSHITSVQHQDETTTAVVKDAPIRPLISSQSNTEADTKPKDIKLSHNHIEENNICDDESMKLIQNDQKVVVPKKQTKTSKQDELKSKLAVAEAHIARLESTITDNANVIRNLKLQQLGPQ